VEAEIDLLLDDIRNMIDEIKTRLQQREEAKIITLRKQKEDSQTCLEEYTQKMTLHKYEIIDNVSAVREFIKNVCDSKSGSTKRQEKFILRRKQVLIDFFRK
jgi:polyphosphate kinase